MERLLELSKNSEEEEGTFGIWVPYDPVFDMSIVVTLLVAVITVALGSFWSGYVKHHLRMRLQEMSSLPTTTTTRRGGRRRARTNSSDDEEAVEEGGAAGTGAAACTDDEGCSEGGRSRRDSASPGPGLAEGGHVDEDHEQIVDGQSSDASRHVHPTEEISLRISPTYVLFYVILMCGMLVLLYFFMDYLGESLNRNRL